RKKYHEKIRAGEKEAIGFASTCRKRPEEVPWIVIKGVSDFGDKDKDQKGDEKDRQLLAAVAASTYLRLFIERGLTWPPLVCRNTSEEHGLPAKFHEITLKIGLVGEWKNSSPIFGPEVRNGLRMVFDERLPVLNEVGINLDLVERDDEGN